MTGYLICEDGPLAEWVFTFEEDETFTIGRDGDVCNFVIEDPMVSRSHLTITKEGSDFSIENKSATNPALLNDEAIEGAAPLTEGDLVQIGNNIFRFTLKAPSNKEEEVEPAVNLTEEELPLTLGRFPSSAALETNHLIKVVNGPSAGSSFALQPGKSYIVGTDSNTCDILLHDLSISKNHARITLSESGEASIIDLNSKNGVFVEGKKIALDKTLKPEDLIILGTTSLVFIDMNQTRETIYSPSAELSLHPEKSIFSGEEEEAKEENWKETFIPTKHLAIASVFSVFICIGIISMLSLFRSSVVEMPKIDETANIASAISHFEDIEFNYNKDTATLFLTGHVLTDVDYNELLYRLKNIPFIKKTDDNVVIDNLVNENINALILKNPRWNSILIISKQPGIYLLTGYIETEKDKAELIDFVNKYFTYLNRLDNQVVVIDTLNTHISTLLMENGFANVAVEQNMGQIVLSGRAHLDQKDIYNQVLAEINQIHGVRSLQNFVIFTSQNTAAVNITDKYKVTGSSKYGNNSQFVLISGKILGVDDTLDGMTITEIKDKEVLLKKDGIKYKIDFND